MQRLTHKLPSLLLSAALAAWCGSASAQEMTTPARSWAADAANNEAQVIQHSDSYLRYRLHVVDEKGDQVRDQLETPDGSVARLILRDGKPLTADEDSAERGRLQYLLDNPAVFTHHIKNEDGNRKLGIDLLHLMPDAMIWSYAPGQPPPPHDTFPAPFTQPASDPPLIVLDFKPDPKWSPPNIPATALTGLEGRVWIDSRAKRVVYLQGDLFRAVNIGWGMLAHLYPGASVVLQQTNTGIGQRWILAHVVEQLSVRALMVKTVHQKLVYDTSDYQPAPHMTYQEAIHTLLNTPLPQH